MASYLLQEDASRITLEDGSGSLLLESDPYFCDDYFDPTYFDTASCATPPVTDTGGRGGRVQTGLRRRTRVVGRAPEPPFIEDEDLVMVRII